MATEIREGMQIRIPCVTKNGAFKDEYLITIKIADDEISGFIDSDIVSEDEQGNKFVIGVVREVREAVAVIRLPGSFFETAGFVHVPLELLEPRHDPVASRTSRAR